MLYEVESSLLSINRCVERETRVTASHRPERTEDGGCRRIEVYKIYVIYDALSVYLHLLNDISSLDTYTADKLAISLL